MDSSSENASAIGNNEMPSPLPPPPPNTSQTTQHVPPLPPKSKRKRPNKQTSSIWDHFTKMEASAKDGASNNNNSVLSLMAMNMKAKFDKYWGSLEKMNKLMFVAMVIDPRTDDLKQSNNVTMEVENDEEVDPWITFCALREEENSMEVENDLTSYLFDKDVVDKEEFDIMYWWKMNAYKYPILSTIVRDVLTVPISTVASESAFSTGGRILDSFRSSLTPKTVETLICTQNWIRGDSVLLDLHPQLEG
ncbi:zinc finger BED domain-containing protein RICESLEEPER 1-like [Cucumis melo var. makuwa]|uniref:Zinc finger BED domain-containing protein RICESLEEPER 1-like n=1 Tax=Cucumis melo var. makuwa TaxID=1194695 RepID=A0A5D3BZT5_CUCMM|nr:zinc finger BED domain-containing protein RICESLEEPER 1-like [Cucumis melo var. makuwa]